MARQPNAASRRDHPKGFEMRIAIKWASAVLGLALIAQSTFATAAENRIIIGPDQPRPPETHQQATDDDGLIIDTDVLTLKPKYKVQCTDATAYKPGYIMFANYSNVPLKKGSVIILVIQPGGKTITLVLPIDLPPYTGVWVPDAFPPGTPDVTCSATIASLK
jgi:hypothetical protein